MSERAARTEGSTAGGRDLPRTGDTVSEKYRIRRVLGAGSATVVVAAEHLSLGNAIALKFMRPDLAVHAALTAAFVEGARASALLRNEHALRILDVERLETGAPYIVMEYLEGETLASVLAREGSLPVRAAVTCMLQACAAIAEAHERGIVHRDIRPQSLFALRSEGAMIKVLDFGLAKVRELAGGVPRFVTPERITHASQADVRSDIWAIGATIYELLAGAPPFTANDARTLYARILEGARRPLRAVRPDVPPVLDEIVSRCMARDPRARYATVRELLRALETSLLPPREPWATTTPVIATGPAEKRRYPIATFVGLLLASGAAAGTIAWVRANEPPPAPERRQPAEIVRERARVLVTSSPTAIKPRTSRGPSSRPR